MTPGDFERRGLVTDRMNAEYAASTDLGTETQYLVAGARVVWKAATTSSAFERDARVTLALSNLLQSTSGVVDLVTGELLEVATYYPNGARETLRANTEVEEFALEPVGFTGKEDDSEVGLVYFGMRYLMPHLGRWASPDPLHIHAGGGGEFGNSYHYVSGNLLQARDPLGLQTVMEGDGHPATPRGARDATASRGELRPTPRVTSRAEKMARLGERDAEAHFNAETVWAQSSPWGDQDLENGPGQKAERVVCAGLGCVVRVLTQPPESGMSQSFASDPIYEAAYNERLNELRGDANTTAMVEAAIPPINQVAPRQGNVPRRLAGVNWLFRRQHQTRGWSRGEIGQFRGRRVYMNNDDFELGSPTNVDPRFVDVAIRRRLANGETNLDLMRTGNAPIGRDGRPINLHHVIGAEPGPMVEVQGSVHSDNHRALHGLIENGRSFRQNPRAEGRYNRFRRAYWRWRAEQANTPAPANEGDVHDNSR